MYIQLKNIQEWGDLRPYKAVINIPTTGDELACVEVYTDISAALCEAVKISSGRTPPLWIEGSSRSIFLSQVCIKHVCTYTCI
jgi:predicted aminopeptidase